MIECNVCGEEARPWHDRRRNEKGWCCLSKECTGGGRTTRYTPEWLREKLGKALGQFAGMEGGEVVAVIVLSLVFFGAAFGISYAIVREVRVPDPQVITKYEPIKQPCALHAEWSQSDRTYQTCLFDNRSGQEVRVACVEPSTTGVSSGSPTTLISLAEKIGCTFGPGTPAAMPAAPDAGH